ncbi:MAG: permease prefix domain 1-containing protein [Armatimonadota bacterium]
MTNLKLEQYVEKVAVNLKSLPESERTSQLDELRQHLESLVAARRAEGESEEIATETALKQFGSAREIGADLSRSVWRMRLKRLPEPVVTALSLIAAISLTTLFFQFGVGPILRAVVPVLPPPSGVPARAVTTHMAVLTPSFLFGIAAFALLLFRDGAARTIRGLMNLQTAVGAALIWLVISKLGGSILFLSLGHALQANQLWDVEALGVISPVCSLVPAAVAAWIVTRIVPRSGVAGIAGSILVSSLASLMDIAWNSGFGSLAFFHSLLTYGFWTVPYLAVAMAFAFLASGLNRRQRYARAA